MTRPQDIRHQRFAEEYLRDLNGAQAAIRAGYSPNGANVTGSQLLAHPSVASAVAAAQSARLERTRVDADRVVLELARLAYMDPRDLFDETGKPKPLHALSAGQAAAVAQIDFDSEGNVKRYKLTDKARCLELLGRHTGIFEIDNRQRSVRASVDMNQFFGDLFRRPDAGAIDITPGAPDAAPDALAPAPGALAPAPGARSPVDPAPGDAPAVLVPDADDLSDLIGDADAPMPDASGDDLASLVA